jgi:tetratricopeptide (TPR) repeat protein
VELMRRLLLFTVFAIGSAALPALANDEQDCFQGKEPEIRIKGCSNIILRDPNDATAYHNRAVAYGLAGDLDHAIADYTKAIDIAPNSAAAYDNRGRAYASKGDYTRALADVIKARELVAKATAQPGVPAPKPPSTAAVPPKTKATPNASGSAAKETSSSSWPAWASFRDRSAD